MIRNDLITKFLLLQRNAVALRHSSNKLNIEILENEQQSAEVYDDEERKKEESIEMKRNKSRLKGNHRNLLLEQNPYPEPAFWHHGTLKHIRRTYGRYGEASGVNPAVCWPVKQELQEALEYERVKYPFTIPQMVEAVIAKKEEKQKKIMDRQMDIAKKMLKLEQWQQELHDKIAKKENEALEAKLRKERLVEEVKRHFGYSVDPRDERFKELLDKKEKEQKKAMKEIRKKAREEKIVEKMLKKKHTAPTEEGDTAEKAEKVE